LSRAGKFAKSTKTGENKSAAEHAGKDGPRKGTNKMRRVKKDSGYILVTVAILLFVLLMFVAIGVDVGVLYASRAQSQRAADAGALAGAYVFTESAASTAAAESQARQVAIANSTLGTTVPLADVTAAADLVNRRITVTVTRNEPLFFGKIFGVSTTTVSTHATAEAANFSSGSMCVKPIFIPNTLPALAGDTLATACMANRLLVDANLNPTSFATEGATGSLIGQQLTIRPGSPSGALVPGDYYSLQVGTPGGNQYQEAWAFCAQEKYQCLNMYPVETGNMAGPTRQGVEGSPNGDPGLLESPPDTWQALRQYVYHGSGPVMDTSRQLVLAPIADLCAYAGTSVPPGSTISMTIVGFAQMFVDGMAANGGGGGGNGGGGGGNGGGGSGQGDVRAHLVNVIKCKPLSNPSAVVSGAGAYGYPLRLVRLVGEN
jgi:Flp pilus assembly protein TadG